MAPRRRCPTCGSRQWHKEPSSGLIACSEGHVLQNYRNETNEVDQYLGPHVLIKRKLKSAGKKKEKRLQANLKLYHGARGRYHYFLCQQLILRIQVEAIIKLWHLPPEYETICRDIWSLHLSLLPDPPPPEPFSYLQGFGDKNSLRESTDTPRASAPPAVVKDALKPSGENDHLSDGGTRNQEDIGESEKSETEDDSEMEEMMYQNSEISSTSEEEDPEEPLLKVPGHSRIGGRNKAGSVRILESPASTLAVLVVALWILRIPVLYRDLARIIETHELPYLDPVRLLPANIITHLTKHSIQALSPPYVPSTLSVHRLAARLAKKSNSSYGVFIPECNAGPLLWRLTRSIGGTPTLYTLTKRLAYVLALPLTLHSTLAPGLRRIKSKDPGGRKYDNVPPEVALMSTIIIVLKMAYGLDGKPRSPRNVEDPALALPRFEDWLFLLKKLDDIDASNQDGLFSSENALAVGDLDEALLDDYLSFCEHALIGSESDVQDVIRTFFPVQDNQRSSAAVKKKPTQPPLPAGALSEGFEDGARPADDHTIWNSRDIFGTLPEDYQALLGRAAKSVRTREGYLSGVVELYERRFVRWWDMEKRRGKGGSDSDEAKE